MFLLPVLCGLLLFSAADLRAAPAFPAAEIVGQGVRGDIVDQRD
jgi:hypothetical protein